MLQTENGNIKATPLIVSVWVDEWVEKMKQDPDMIQRAFSVCGLFPKTDDFTIEKLHRPLRELLDDGFLLSAWMTNHGNTLETQAPGIIELLLKFIPSYLFRN